MNRFPLSLVVALAVGHSILASEDTIGPNGINSVATGLTGLGGLIGQVDGSRPGQPGHDTAANCCNADVHPFLVYARDHEAGENEGLGDGHALYVASVMISSQDTIGTPGREFAPLGVAPAAALTSSAYILPDIVTLHQDAALAAQAIAPFVLATNMSFGLPDEENADLDGGSTLTSFVDWSTPFQEVLYIVAGNEIGPVKPFPTDNFNGITVAASTKLDGVFRRVSSVNVFNENLDALGDRTSTLILAPGQQIDVAGPNGTQPTPQIGTSFAAPHVTGTHALLQEQASINNGRHHLTMKAVILNSADKIKDILGMERTVVKNDSMTDWFGTTAHSDPAIPVDREMGVGHLKANRAVLQHAGGEQPSGGDLIGWDLATQNDPFIPNKYTLNLDAGDFVSATLVWDREVFLNSPFLEYQRGDEFIDFGFANLDLYLVPAGGGIAEAVASSTSTAWNLEHIFASVETAGNYELQVWIDEMNEIPYALAWWAGADERTAQGDFNSDGSVDAADYVVWRKTDGSPTGYDEFRTNFGSGSGAGGVATVPEPNGSVFVIALIVGAYFGRISAMIFGRPSCVGMT